MRDRAGPNWFLTFALSSPAMQFSVVSAPKMALLAVQIILALLVGNRGEDDQAAVMEPLMGDAAMPG